MTQLTFRSNADLEFQRNEERYAANFIPQTVVDLVATLLVGNMFDRLRIRWVALASMSPHSHG